MEYKDFIDEYYYEPQYMYERGIMVVFYPKVRDKVNPDDPTMYNGGCVFTKKPLTGEPGEQYMNCSLYDDKCYDDLTSFPVGCITDLGDNNFENYYIFNQYRMAMLNYFYPHSSKKFRKKYWGDLVDE